MQPTETKPGTPTKVISKTVRFSEEYLLRTLGVSRSQLRAWVRAGWIASAAAGVVPAARGVPDDANASDRKSPNTSTSLYAHADLLALKTLLRLRKGGVSGKKLRLIHDSLKQRFNALGINRPFSELHLTGEDKRALLTFRGARMEPLTGQLLLEYSATNTRPLMMPETSSGTGERRATSSRAGESSDSLKRAERFFSAGLRFERMPGGVPKAIRAYRTAIELNPRALGALLNLGTLYYNQRQMDEAERFYAAALAVNPRSALAHFNMGNVADETAQTTKAIEHYEKAIALDGSYPDPRYNLALVYEKLGRHGQAWKNWRAYLKLDPDSKWAALARDKLAQQQWRVVRSSHGYLTEEGSGEASR